MSSSLAKPGTAPACWTSRNDQSVRVVYCSHSVLTRLCRAGFGMPRLCWEFAESTALIAYVLPMCSHLCSKFIAFLHIPFPFSLHIGFIAGMQNMFCIWNALVMLDFLCSKPTAHGYLLLTGNYGQKYASSARVLSDCCGALLIWDLLAHHSVWNWPVNFSSFPVSSVLWFCF